MSCSPEEGKKTKSIRLESFRDEMMWYQVQLLKEYFQRMNKNHKIPLKHTTNHEGETSAGKQQLGNLSRRSSQKHAIDWNLCMFCQDKYVKNIHNV